MQRLREQAFVISGEPVLDSPKASHTNDTSDQNTDSKTAVVDVDMPDVVPEPVLRAASPALPAMSSELSSGVNPDDAEAAASQAWSPQPAHDQWADSQKQDGW